MGLPLFRRKRKVKPEQATGRILRFNYVNGEHYPCVAFMTASGLRVEGRDRLDAPVEERVHEDHVESLIMEKLGTQVLVAYSPENPLDFEILVWA